ncbi:MAG TPA: LysM domain-containing protein, partial [Egibacteraceae bacterium]|nr:LysM domain-containing protein [Egibacteraceae bacterium]
MTASAAALVLAGFSAPAEAHTPDETPAPSATEHNVVDTAAEERVEDETVQEEAVQDDAAQDGPDTEAAPEAAEPVLYEVLPGDYLASIAAENGLDPVEGWRLLFDANPDVADPDVILPGQVLRIPGPDEQLEPRALPTPPP